MKKTIITTILAGAMIFSLAACNGSGNNDAKGLDTVESVYGIGAVTTAKLLMETEHDAKPLAVVLADEVTDNATGDSTTGGATDPAVGENDPQFQLPQSGDASAEKAQGEAETFNQYFTMLEGFLDKSATTTQVGNNDSADPLLADYTTKMVVTGKNEKGETNVHTLYYTETKVDPSRYDDDHDFDDDDRDEIKTVEAYSLEGVLEMGTDENGTPVYFYMTGYRSEETEKDGRETETKSELSIRASQTKGDRSDYVVMQHEMESEEERNSAETESEYTYSVYQGGRLLQSTSVSFETENQEAEYEMEYTANGVRSWYEIERVERGGNVWIEVEYNIGGSRGKFVIVRDANGDYNYKFTDSKADDRHFDHFDD